MNVYIEARKPRFPCSKFVLTCYLNHKVRDYIGRVLYLVKPYLQDSPPELQNHNIEITSTYLYILLIYI